MMAPNAPGHRERPKCGLSGLVKPQRGRDAVEPGVSWSEQFFVFPEEQ